MSSPSSQSSNASVLTFIVVLSIVCAVVLSSLASALRQPQEVARELYRSTQMLVAAQIFNASEGHFQLPNDAGEYIPAKAESDGTLVAGDKSDVPSGEDVLAVYRNRFRPYLVDEDGDLVTFEEAGINEQEYTDKHRKRGYYRQPLKLIYKILPNDTDDSETATGYVIPVNGYGLWDAIYGYLAISSDGLDVIGISWYEHKETPGLGANIAEPDWQSHFPGKHLFQMASEGTTDLSIAPVGITVVRGKVAEVLGEGPKAKSAVDGMAGATLTGNGVTKAYKDVLDAYRPFLMAIHEQESPKN